MVDKERAREAVEYLDEWDYLNPRIERDALTVGEVPNNIMMIPLDHIEKIDTPDQEYVSWVKVHTENQMERLVNIMDADRPEIGRRVFERFMKTGKIQITFAPPDRTNDVKIERMGVWSTNYTAYKGD